MTKNFLLYITGVVLLVGACVPAKEFNNVQEQYHKCQEETNILKKDNEELSVRSTELASRIKVLTNELEKLLEDSTNKAIEIKTIKTSLEKLDRQYNDLQLAQEELLKGNAVETRRLLQQLQTTQEDLQVREDLVREMEANLKDEQKNLNLLKTELEERNKRMVELEGILFSKDSIMDALKKKVSNALLGFENNGLTVKRQEGKIYVSLEEKLLFASGSAEIGQNGVNALKKLAKVLEENPEIDIMIEGHTDDLDYIPDAAIKDNWDLSVKRATTVVRILLKHSSIDPKRLTASGRSEYIPLDPSKNPAARQKNRRTEIILAPKLNELFEIVDAN